MRRSERVLSGIVFAVLGVFASVEAAADVAAGTPKFSVTLPTQNSDGSAIPATGQTALKEWRLYCDSIATAKAVIPAPASTYQAVAGEFAAGSHTCQATAVNNAAKESSPTAAIPFAIPYPAPNAPTGLTVQ